MEQLDLAVRAVFRSWATPRATLYRRQEHIADDLGTAVNVMAMVFGNRGPDSGTGVAFTRDPASGAPGVYGDYLEDAQGEDVVAGVRNTMPLADLQAIDPDSYAGLLAAMNTLERHYRDLCDIEFTIERGRLWILQTRVGKRTAAAAFRIATQLVDEGLISLDEALMRVTGAQLGQLMFPRFDQQHEIPVLARGVAASPGAAVGVAAFDSAAAQRFASSGRQVILVRRETNPDDLPGMVASAGILTTRGGKTSHAAVVARGMGKTCVCGVDTLDGRPRRAACAGARWRRCRGRRPAVPRRPGRPRLPRRGAGRSVAGGRVLRGPRRADRRPGTRRRPDPAARRWPPYARRTRQCGHSGRRSPGPPVRGRGHRSVPHRAHVPRRTARSWSSGWFSPRARRPSRPLSTNCCRCSAMTSPGSSGRWPACR